MHILILSKRNAEAQIRMIAAANRLARYFGLPADLVQALTVQEKDPQVRAMRERESVTALLETLAVQVGATPAAVELPVTPVTADEAPAFEILAPPDSVAPVSIQAEETTPPVKTRKKKGL
jgi:hypothetical protein